jgi:hypothetical protein
LGFVVDLLNGNIVLLAPGIQTSETVENLVLCSTKSHNRVSTFITKWHDMMKAKHEYKFEKPFSVCSGFHYS